MSQRAEDVTIFLIEDDDIDAMELYRYLHKEHITNPVVRAGDGLEALEMLKNNEVQAPYIILLDLNLPRMNGLEFLEAIRLNPRFKHSVVFVLTTSGSNQDILASYVHYIAGYFLKEKPGEGIQNLVKMLQGYWKLVQLPNSHRQS